MTCSAVCPRGGGSSSGGGGGLGFLGGDDSRSTGRGTRDGGTHGGNSGTGNLVGDLISIFKIVYYLLIEKL